jgi:hypothetical protein
MNPNPSIATNNYCRITTLNGEAKIRVGGNAKEFFANVYDTSHNDITKQLGFTFCWEHDIDNEQVKSFEISDLSASSIKIKAEGSAGKKFTLTLKVTDSEQSVYVPATMDFEVIPFF